LRQKSGHSAAGLHQYHQERLTLLAWERLTLPEQDLVALACLGYSNGEIAARLQKTRPGIVKRLRKTYIKLGVKNRTELRALFISWDFSSWGTPSDLSR
jgi:DNA-binding CsgD family transcriptional regulator